MLTILKKILPTYMTDIKPIFRHIKHFKFLTNSEPEIDNHLPSQLTEPLAMPARAPLTPTMSAKDRKREYNKYYYLSKKLASGGFIKSSKGIHGLRQKIDELVSKETADHVAYLEKQNERLIGNDVALRNTFIETIQTYLGMLSKCNRADAIESAITQLQPFDDNWDAKDQLEWYKALTETLHKII